MDDLNGVGADAAVPTPHAARRVCRRACLMGFLPLCKERQRCMLLGYLGRHA